MEFANHVFISYAHLDNPATFPAKDGWITRLQATLTDMLAGELAVQPSIWRDAKLRANDEFTDEIVGQLPQTAVLISILTKRYLGSTWCRKEVEDFCRFAEQQHPIGVRIGNKFRVFNILKSPVDHEHSLPDIAGQALNYKFYEEDDKGNHYELDPIVYGEEKVGEYNKAVRRLAIDIADLIESIATVSATPTALAAAADPSDKPAVYLAECHSDLDAKRQSIRDELVSHGYLVLPDRPLPRDQEAYAAAVAELIEHSILSVHLIGARHGMIPEDGEESIEVVQNAVATQASRERGLRRIVWLPEGTIPATPRQKAFIDRLQTDPDAQFGADLITSPEAETVKTAIHATLDSLKKKSPVQEDTSAAKSVYVICDPRDLENMVGLIQHLEANSFEVTYPSFDGDAETTRKENEDLLQSNAVIIFYGAGGESWRRAVDSEARKIRGAAGAKFPVYTCVAGPATGQKALLAAKGGLQLLNCLDAFSAGTMSGFVDELRKATP